MRRLIIILLVLVAGWQGYTKYQGHRLAQADDSPASETTAAPERTTPEERPAIAPTTQFRCDGRTHCSHMTSCEEATFFLRNCPNTKMDGDHDGIPCEQQWCGG